MYVSAVDRKGRYLAEQAKTKLGKASVGKSCIRFKKLADLDIDALRDVLTKVKTASPLGAQTEGAASAGKDRRSAPRSKRPKAARTRAKQR